jgi:hypothetical protein
MDMETETWLSAAPRPVGLIIRQKDPNNLEMPFDQLLVSISVSMWDWRLVPGIFRSQSGLDPGLSPN